MAKTQSDYEAEGAQLFNDGKNRPIGDSWQAKAWSKGWTDANDLFQNAAAKKHVDDCQLREFGDIDKSLTDEIVNMKTEGFAEGGYVAANTDHVSGIVTPGEQFISIHMNTWMHGRKTVEHHINFLKNQAKIELHEERFTRLMTKIAKLQKKHGIKKLGISA